MTRARSRPAGEQSEAFMQNTLMPALPVPGGFAGLPDEHTADVTHHATV